ncbi:hypothetical protein E4U13_008072, partial [Claviceps humidiphila]
MSKSRFCVSTDNNNNKYQQQQVPTTTDTNNIVMADWCDLTLGNPLDEQPDFDGERTESARPQSAKSSKTSRICGHWPVGFQWTSSGLPVDFQWTSSGLPVDFQWTSSGLAILVVGQRRVFGRKWTSFENRAPESTSEAASRRSSFSHTNPDAGIENRERDTI